MTASDDQLAALCAQTASTAMDAADWLDRNKAEVGPKWHGLRREFRWHEVLARRFETAARRPLSIGVFGPSQTGKSYLVSALARRGTKPLIVMLDKEREYLKEINPETDDEATGLVTRFSINPTGATGAMPVAVRLLSQTDIIKILANTYFLDFDPTKERVPADKEVEEALAQARSRVAAAPVDDNLTDVDIDGLRRYFDEQFATHKTTEVLTRTGYWAALMEIAPRLALQGRLKLYSFLWGGLAEFSDVYAKLYEALHGLGFAEEACCPIEALLPRDTSIINVKTLAQISAPSSEKLLVRGKNGKTHEIHRAHLTAIVSELLFQIREQPWDFFNHTDLLDFPGARSREMNEDAETYVKRPGQVGALFNRGKVAYLFDRYCANHEMPGMVLCLAPGNQEVRTLPGMVSSWIHETHGLSAARRAKQSTALFLILTKFDLRFKETEGRTDDGLQELWTSALKTAVTGFFGTGQDNWAQEWHPGRPFDNCFWLRNPNFIERGLMRYDEDGGRTELGILYPARIAKFKQVYLANDLVRRHIRNPEAAWNAAFDLNDGGISYLAAALAPVCQPELKTRQIAARLQELRDDMADMLREFHVSDDGGVEKKKRIDASVKAVVSLKKVSDGRRFGHLIKELQVANDDLQSLFRRLTLTGDISDGAEADYFEILDDIGLERPATNDGRGRRDRDSDLANAALEYWGDRLQALVQHTRILNFLRIEPGVAEIIVREILAGSERLKLSDEIAARIRAVTPASEPTAVAAAEGINHYVFKLGQDLAPVAQRAKVKAGSARLPVFQEREPIDSIDQLPEQQPPFHQDYIRDWLASFLDLVEKNAARGLESKFSREERGVLDKIMTGLAA
jgi:hypothetical protein